MCDGRTLLYVNEVINRLAVIRRSSVWWSGHRLDDREPGVRFLARSYIFFSTPTSTPWSRVLPEKLTGHQLVKKFPAFYGTRRFITAFTTACPYPEQIISPGPRLCIVFRNMVIFYGEELLAPRPNTKLEDHPLSAVRDCLFKVFAATIHIPRPFLHRQPDDAPCRSDKKTLIMVLG
jgi:hypothetical protein